MLFYELDSVIHFDLCLVMILMQIDDKYNGAFQIQIKSNKYMSIYKPTKFTNSDIMRAINAITYGAKCLYYNQRSLKECIIFIHDQYINVLQIIIQKNKTKFIKLNEIQNVTDKNNTIQTKLDNYNLKNFVVLTTKSFETYVFAMKTKLEKQIIWQGLQFFIVEGIMFFDKIEEVNPFKAEAMMMFLEYDKRGQKRLKVDDVFDILTAMKIRTTKQQLLKLIHQINQEYYKYYSIKQPSNYHRDNLQFQTFQKLIKYYSKKEQLMLVFKEYCMLFDDDMKHYKTPIKMIKYFERPIMSADQLVEFKKNQHFQNITFEEAKQIIQSYIQQTSKTKDKQHGMSFFNFSNYIFSPKNSIFDPEKTTIYQDMSQPLGDYYIYSSHNTYLSGDQLKSDSKTQMYQFALKKGCRCVQLDIHNGKGGTPIVKHGGTITKPITFQDTIKTIGDYSFLTNQYPVVLSFQNHCSRDQQLKMAEIISNILGDQVYTLPKNYLQYKGFPSPQFLKGKIVIKGDGKPELLYDEEAVNDHKILDQIEQNQDEQENQGQKQKQSKAKQKKKQVKKPVKHQMKLLQQVTMFNSKLDLQKFNRLPWNSCSLDEGKVNVQKQNRQEDIIKYSSKFLIRTYPSGTRVDSSNYDPTPAFNIGAHIIALNLQTPDKHHYLLHSKFIQNGGHQCGYLLKPEWMRSSCKNKKLPSQFSQPVAQLKVKVESGQKLIIRQNVRSPLRLEVYIKGNVHQQSKNQVFISDVIQNNAFNPAFKMDCKFKIYCPDLAMLVFDVVSTKNSQILSSVAVNYNCIRQGLRVAPLLGPSMRFGKGSYLLVFVQKIPIVHNVE